MFKNIFKKNSKETIEESKDSSLEKEITKPLKKEVEETIKIVEVPVKKENSFEHTQFLDMGMDMKEEVAKISKGFFQSRNQDKLQAYASFQQYLLTLSSEDINKLKRMSYFEFKEKEGQILTKIKNGYSQHVSKGKSLDDSMRKYIEIIFADIKKLPSRGHRYWYYTTYIWQ